MAQAQLEEPLSVSWMSQLSPDCEEACLAKKLALLSTDITELLKLKHEECYQATCGEQCIVGLERGDRGQRDCRGCSLKLTVISLVNSCLIVSVGVGASRGLEAACTFNHVKLAIFALHRMMRPRDLFITPKLECLRHSGARTC